MYEKERKYHSEKNQSDHPYRLLTGVRLPLAESFRDEGVGVGVLLFALACSTNLAYIT